MDYLGQIEINQLINNIAKILKDKKLVQPCDWAEFVKTGVHKERPPVDSDWWYIEVPLY